MQAYTQASCEALNSQALPAADGSGSWGPPPAVPYAKWQKSARAQGQIKGVDAANYDSYFALLYSVYSFPCAPRKSSPWLGGRRGRGGRYYG